MQEGWIKLYRKILDNKLYRHDPNAIRLFIHLLLTVDKRTGSRDTGRFQLSYELDMNPNTIYAATKRLEKAEMITQVSNNKYSVISICNWQEYQGNGNTQDNNQITTRQQQDNTIQEVRIKNKEYNPPISPLSKISCLTDELAGAVAKQYHVAPGRVRDVMENLKLYCQSKGKRYQDYSATLKTWVRRDIAEGKIPVLKEVKEYVPVEHEVVYSPEKLKRVEETRRMLVEKLSLTKGAK